jgi:peptide/nickel transport system substrate-binding protein
MRPLRLVPLWLSLCLALAACGTPFTAAPPAGEESRASGFKRIVIAIRSEPTSLVQQRTQRTENTVRGLYAVEEMLHAGLTFVKDDGKRVPQLAQDVPSLENGLWKVFPDGRMEVTWVLKENARWQDGTPVTTDDLLFATTIEKDRDLAIPPYPEYELIGSIRAPDARTIVVDWRRPYIEADGLFSYRSAGLPLPKHLLEEAYLDDKTTFLGLPFWTSGFVGAGPFKMKEWAEASYTVLAASDSFIFGRPKIDEVEVRFIADPSAIMTSLLAGLDMTLGKTLTLDQALQVREQWQDGTVYLRRQSWAPLNPQFINPSPAVVADRRFRAALLLALDRQQLVDTVSAGHASVAHSYVNPDVPYYTIIEPAIVRYGYEPRQATQLIESLGYTRGSDGIFADARGLRLVVSVYTPVQNDIHAKTLTAIADQWQQIGVATDQVLVPAQRMGDREYLAQFPAFELVERPNNLTLNAIRRFHSSQTPLPENQFRAFGNTTRYRNAVLDTFIDSYSTTIPIQERMEALAGMVHHQTTGLTQLPLFFGVEPTLIANRLMHVTPRGDTFTQAWNASQWDVRS